MTEFALIRMGQIIALADFRKEKLKAKLFKFADNQSPAIVETQTTTIAAMRIFCRDLFVVLIDKFGYQNSVNYSEITDVSPMLPVKRTGRSCVQAQAQDTFRKDTFQDEIPHHDEISHVVVSFSRPSARS